MKIGMKILCVGLITVVSLGSISAMRSTRKNRGNKRRGYVAQRVVRRPAVPTPPQRVVAEDHKDFALAFDLQAQEYNKMLALLQEESTVLADNNEQLKRDEELARRLQDGSDDDDGDSYGSDSYDDETDLQVDCTEDEALARRIQAELDAENVLVQPVPLQRDNPPVPLQRNLPPVPPAVNPPADVEADDCTICAATKSNVWTMCCLKRDICKGCLDTWFRTNKVCPFCRQANPKILNAETMQNF